MKSDSDKIKLKKENNDLIQWMLKDLEDINSEERINRIKQYFWRSYELSECYKSELYDFCRYLGLGSMVLKAAKLNLEIDRRIFLAESSRLSFGGNLGWSKNVSLKILEDAKVNGLLKDVPGDLIKKFESEIKSDKKVLILRKSIVWFPIVDLKTDMVMFDACYSNKKGVSSCYASADITKGNSKQLALLIQEFIAKNYANRSICLQYIATGTITIKKIGRVENIIPKLKAALDFGIPDIFAPLENKKECDKCEDLYNHSDYSNIHWVSDIDEVKNYIHQQFNDLYSVKQDDPFALQTYQAMLPGRQSIKDKDSLKFDNNTNNNIDNNSNKELEFENRINQIKKSIIAKDIKSAYLGYEELEKVCDKLLLEDDNRFFKTKYYKIKCLYYLFKDKELYSDEKFSSEWHTFGIKWTENKITAYYDDVAMESYENDGSKDNWPYDQNFYIILNLAIGGDLGGNDSQVNSLGGQAEFLIDYVRVYQ